MNKLRPMALLCAGPVSRSPLARLPNLRRHLFWVKAGSYRVASRAVNALGAGTPVVELEEMRRAGIWVISVPPDELAGSLEELRSAKLDWRKRILLILDGQAESCIADSFRPLGVSVATFGPIDPEGSRYFAEGDSDAIRAVHQLVGEPRTRRVVELKRGTKASYLAGADSVTKQVLPLVAEAVERFQSAGLSLTDAKLIAETLLTGAMRSYFRAGRRAIKS
jgi:hypothetical protein